MKSPEETRSLAAAFGRLLVPGETVLLSGEVGAGKSHFARSLIQARLLAAGVFEDVPSPTYTLVQTYSDGKSEIWHADLYRLSDTSEIIELGLDHAMQEAICLIEWPDRLGGFEPEKKLNLLLETGEKEDERWITFDGTQELCRKFLSAITETSLK